MRLHLLHETNKVKDTGLVEDAGNKTEDYNMINEMTDKSKEYFEIT